jgi:predicted flap endonuclease-1-like 5' DNA nuclease
MFEDAEATGYAGAEPAPEAVQAADDLTRMVGVGPRIAAALAARGVTRFADLASWGMAELEAFDRDLKLKGRALRSDWIDQARRLAAE